MIKWIKEIFRSKKYIKCDNCLGLGAKIYYVNSGNGGGSNMNYYECQKCEGEGKFLTGHEFAIQHAIPILLSNRLS